MATKGVPGRGSTLVLEESGFVCQWTSIDFANRGARDATEMTSSASDDPGPGEFGGKDFIPSGRGNPGTFTIEAVYAQDQTPPYNRDAESAYLELPICSGYASATRYSGKLFLIDEGIAVPQEEGHITQSLTFQCTGVWTKTPAVKE